MRPVPRLGWMVVALALLLALVSIDDVRSDTIGLWGRAVPTADDNHPNLFWNMTEIGDIRQMIQNNNPAYLRSLYDTYMRGVVASSVSGDGSDDGTDTAGWYAAISYMVEPTTAKANAIRDQLLSFIAAHPSGPGNWYDNRCVCGYIMALWYDLVQGIAPGTFSTAQRNQIKAWFQMTSRTLYVDSNDQCVVENTPPGCPRYISNAAHTQCLPETPQSGCDPITPGPPMNHQGKSTTALVNWYVRYMGPTLAAAFMGGTQTDVDFWIDSGWPHTQFGFDGVTPTDPPDTQNRWEVMLYLLSVYADGAHYESYTREKYNDLTNPKSWSCTNYYDPTPKDGCAYHFAVTKDAILGAIMGYHNGMNQAYQISDIPGDPAIMRIFKKAIASRNETDTNPSTLTGHPNIGYDPIMHIAHRLYPNDPTITNAMGAVWTSGDTFPSGAPGQEVPAAVYPFLGQPTTVTPVVAGTVYYVSAGGHGDSPSDGYSCATATNINTPLRNITTAINNCSRTAGEIIEIRGGTYAEQLHTGGNGGWPNVNWPNGSGWGAGQYFTVRGRAGETVVLNPSWTASGGEHFDIVSIPAGQGEYTLFENITFDGSNLNIEEGGNAVHLGNYNQVSGCIIKNFQPGAPYGGQPFPPHTNGILMGSHNIVRSTEIFNVLYGIYASKEDNLMEGNYIHDTGGYGIHAFDGGNDPNTGGPWVCAFQPQTIRNNYIANTGQNGPTPQTGGGMVIGQTDGTVIYNNVFANAGCGPCSGIQVYNRTCNTKIYYNTIVGSSGNCVDVGSTSKDTLFYNNICYNNGGGINNGGDRSVFGTNWGTGQSGDVGSGNPQFLNMGGGDFHLTASSSSSLRDGGTPISGITTDGSSPPITRDSSPSLGPYEYGVAFTPVQGTFYIATTGTDAVDCTAAQSSGTPRARLANVLGCAAAGSTIWFRSGTYTDTQRLDSTIQPLQGGTDAAHPTIIGTLPSDRAGGQAILRSTAGNALWYFNNSATDKFIQIQALTLDNTSAIGSNTLVFYPNAHDISVSDSFIRNAQFEPLFIAQSYNITFTNTTIDNSDHPSTCAVGIASGASNIFFIRSTIINGAAGGLCTYSTGANNTHVERTQVHDNGGIGIQLQNETNAFIVNNLVYRNTGGGLSLGTSVGNAEVYYNDFWSDTGGVGITVASGATSTVKNNIIFGFATPVSGTISVATKNVTADPGFDTPGPPASFTVHGANVIDQADSIATVTTDFAGNGRPGNDTNFTIGALENETTGTLPSASLTATPSTITAGNSSTLNWSSTNATSCSAPWTVSTATSGSQSVSPTITTTYTVTCTDGTNQATSNATVTVTGTPSVSLTATPSSITAGGSSTLSWTGSNVTSCSAPWTALTGTSGSQSVSPLATSTYTITCTNGTTNVTSNATVTILAAPGPTVRMPSYGSTSFPLFPR